MMLYTTFIYYYNKLALSAVAAEYTDRISAEGYDSPNVSPRYDTKQSDGKSEA